MNEHVTQKAGSRTEEAIQKHLTAALEDSGRQEAGQAG